MSSVLSRGELEDLKASLMYGSRDGDLSQVQQGINLLLSQTSSPETMKIINTAASMAARGGHTNVVRFLLENGASVGSLVPAACQVHTTNIFQVMRDHGWNADQINKDMKQYPFIIGRWWFPSRAAVERLLDHGMDPNLAGHRGASGMQGHLTPFNAIANQGSFDESVVETMQMLLERGAVMDPFVLVNAVTWRQGAKHKTKVLQWLVDYGADVNCSLQSGAPLLHAVIAKGNSAFVRFLLDNNADASATWDGHDALGLARELKLDEICNIIQGHRGGCM